MAVKTKSAAMDLVHAPIASTLFRFSFPFMLSTLLQTLYSTTDTIVVGQFLGQNGLSAVANGSQIMQMLYAALIGFSNGGQVLIAQAKGAENRTQVQRLIESVSILVTAVSLIVGLLTILLHGVILNIMSVPQEARGQAAWYIIICGAGLLFTGLYNLFSAILRALGDSRHPLVFVAIATGINVVLDIVFIALFHWDVAGAALATVIGQACSVLFSIWLLWSRASEFGLDFRFTRYRIRRTEAKMILRISAPMALQMGAVQLSFLFVARLINQLGVSVSAAFGVMQKIRSMPSILTQGFAMGAAAMMGQNLGAGKLDRVSRVVLLCLLFTTVTDVLFGIVYLAAPVFCFRIFTQDPAVLEWAKMVMFVIAIELPANFFMPACNSLVSAQGFVKLSFTVAILDAFLGRIGFCWLLGSVFHLGIFGYFLGYIIGTYVTAVIVGIYYFSGAWKKRAALVEKERGNV